MKIKYNKKKTDVNLETVHRSVAEGQSSCLQTMGPVNF